MDKADVLAGRVHVELPVSLAEIIGGLSDDIERLSGEAGLLIMQAAMKGEVDASPVPREDTTGTARRRVGPGNEAMWSWPARRCP